LAIMSEERLIEQGYDIYPRENLRSPATMPAALARYQFRIECIEAKRAWGTTGDDRFAWLRSTNFWPEQYPRYPCASNPWLWVIRGVGEKRYS
jgi:hypothetical protein